MLLMFEQRGRTRSVFLCLSKHTNPTILLRCCRTEARKIVTGSALLRTDHLTAACSPGDSLARTIGSIRPGQAGRQSGLRG